MDSNPLLLIIVSGGLLLALLYAIYAVTGKNNSISKKKVARKPEEVLEKGDETETESISEPEQDHESIEEIQPEEETSTCRIKINNIEGIGPIYSARLNDLGIQYIDELLEAGSTREGREDLESKTEIPHILIFRWVNVADLFRITGIDEELCDLLEAAGVDTLVELSQIDPENLHSAMVDTAQMQKLDYVVPTLEEIMNWVEQAKSLSSNVEY